MYTLGMWVPDGTNTPEEAAVVKGEVDHEAMVQVLVGMRAAVTGLSAEAQQDVMENTGMFYSAKVGAAVAKDGTLC